MPLVGAGGIQCISTSNIRPSLATTGASSKCVSPSTSGVADIARIRRSGRIVDATSSASARPRSVVRLRSCTSSKMTMPTPGSSGSFWRRRVSTPSVTTSMRVLGPMWRSSRVWYPTSSPTAVRVVDAIRRAAARVARRRGSSMTIRCPPSHGSPRSASGTTVVLPAPGGATSTARRWSRECGANVVECLDDRKVGKVGLVARRPAGHGVSRARGSRGTALDHRGRAPGSRSTT